MKPAQPAKRRLLGWLVVFFLVTAAMFVGLLLPAILHASPIEKRLVAKVDVLNLESALEAYRTVLGKYPTGTAAQILSALRGENASSNTFLTIAPHRVNAAGEYVDTWRTPYRITFDGTGKPFVYSFGPDRQDNQASPQSDDVTRNTPETWTKRSLFSGRIP